LGKWIETTKSDLPCRIDSDHVVAVVSKADGRVEVFLRGGHALTVKGTLDDFAPILGPGASEASM